MGSELSAGDREQIRDVMARYAWALDTGDVEGFAACFAEDGVLVWDAFEEPLEWHGTEALRGFASFLANLPSTAGRQHHISNVVIEGHAAEAKVAAYVAVLVRQPEGAAHPVTVMGWYDDVLCRTSAGWRIARHVIRDWSGPVLAKLAGQTGERAARPTPPALARISSEFAR